MSRQDEKLDAAEYVVGTLSGAERAAFEALMEVDPKAREDVTFWNRIFGDLNSTVSPVIPSGHVWENIERAIDAREGSGSSKQGGFADAVRKVEASSTSSAGATVTPLPIRGQTGSQDTGTAVSTGGEAINDSDAPRAVSSQTKKPIGANDNTAAINRSRSRWRLGAIAASLAALGLGFLLFNQDARTRVDGVLNAGLTDGAQTKSQDVADGSSGSALDKSKEYIAVVNAADQPALIVKVNAATGDVSVRSLGVEKPEGKSLELWYVPEGSKPVSVGLVGEGTIDLGDLSAKSGDLLAISVEPEGGAPEGVATGPVIYSGKLIEDVD